MNPIDAQISAAFPSGKPFEDAPEIVQCKHCKKPVLKLAATAHVRDCLKKKQEKAQKKKEAKEAKDAALRKERNGGVSPDPSLDEEAGKRGTVSARKTALDGDGGGKKVPGKKRKADDDDDVKGPSAKKKKKEEAKPKGGKPKGPVDVEKQCGVVLANGQQCARSLTCKSHSMGAKRAVPGRSLPYDVLLNQYQKKNQAKLQRKSFDILLLTARGINHVIKQARPSMQMHRLPTTSKPRGLSIPMKNATKSSPPSTDPSVSIRLPDNDLAAGQL